MVKREQSLAGLVRQRLPEFEEKFYFGIRQQIVVDALNAEGYEITLSHFKTLIHLARKRAQGKTVLSTQEVVGEKSVISKLGREKEVAPTKETSGVKKYKKTTGEAKGKIDSVIDSSLDLDKYSQLLKDDKK